MVLSALSKTLRTALKFESECSSCATASRGCTNDVLLGSRAANVGSNNNVLPTIRHYCRSRVPRALHPLKRGSYHSLCMPKVLVCPPNYFDVVDQKNPYMFPDHAVDSVKARTQWENLCSVLQQSGCEVEAIDPVEGLEDMVFAANQVFVGEKSGYGKFVVPSHMVYSSRQREVPFYTEWCRSHGYRVIEIDFGHDYLEGHGDLLWHPDGSRIYAAYGFRSTRGGIEKFATAMSEMGIPVVPLELIDPYCYHLDTCLCPLNNEAALIFAGAFSADALAAIHKNWTRVHLLDSDEAHHFMGNGIVVNGRYIAPHMTPQLEGILHQESLTPVVVDTSEFEKAGGSCFCMKAFLP
jgi:N-dimethylarginine dimethylaminohydrolase